MGLTGLPLSTDYGGFGGGAVDLMSVMEAFGEALVVEPYLPTVLAALLVAERATTRRRRRSCPRSSKGKMLAFALANGAQRGVSSRRADGASKVVLVAPMADSSCPRSAMSRPYDA